MDAPDIHTWNPRGFGIREKIVLPLAGVAIAVSIVGVTMIHAAQTRQRERFLHDRAAAIAHAVVHVAKSVSEPAELQRFVTAMASERSVEAIVVAVGDPLIVSASSRAEWLAKRVSELPASSRTRHYLETACVSQKDECHVGSAENEMVDYSVPLRMRSRRGEGVERVPGAVVLRMDGRQILSEQHFDMVRLIVALLAAIGLSSVATYFLLRRLLIQPIAAMAAVARSNVVGQRKARVGWSRQDELGQLGSQFDMMLDEITRREEQERLARELAIQAQRKAESALAELRCVKFALDQHAIVAITDPQGQITYVNDRFCEISQYSRDELIGNTHRIINSGCQPREFWQDMWSTIARGSVWRGEVCNRAKDGTLYWVDTTIVPFQDSCGRITQHVAIRADITQRKRAEAELAERGQQFRTLVNNIPGVPYRCLCDEQWTMLFMGDAAGHVTGYPAEEFIGNAVRSYASVIHPDDRQYVTETITEGLAVRRSFALEYRIVRADGEVRTVSEQGQAVCEEDGGRIRYLDGAIFDISDRKRAEQQLLDERARLTAFVEHAPAAIAMFDRDMCCVAASRRFVSDYQLEGQNVVGRRHDEVMSDQPALGRRAPTRAVWRSDRV